ncbi:MAG: DUF2779 domain-containing protein [Dehalococcoidia bacterium]|nr:DUF2779 domain-containing protein [Dehalococcoidia bacterium]
MKKRIGYRRIPKLSKSSFTAGLQCLKRLYLESYHRDLAAPIDEAQQALFDAGALVGEMARQLYPGGILMDHDYLHIDEAVASTKALLGDTSLAAIYEAGFEFDDIRVRTDILARAKGGRFDLVEVKSGTGVKEEHIPDLAIQLYVLRGAGVRAGRTWLAHLNKDYVYPGGGYDLDQLFKVEDVSKRVQEYQAEIPPALRQMRLALREADAPDIEPGRQCSVPYDCPFFDFCHQDAPEYPVSELPRATERLLMRLKAAGIRDIREIAPGFSGLNPLQKRVRDCVVEGRAYIDPAVRAELQGLVYPVHFLDFETFSPAIPRYAGTRPYQAVPFQWSDHILGADGKLTHEEFLHDGKGDPREPLARSLLETLGAGGSIMVYSGFEEARIRELARDLPRFSKDLLALLEGRLVDLLPILQRHCYHPDFHGSFSLKAVLPALVPDLDYDDLAITDGQAASLAYEEIIYEGTTDDRREQLREELLRYCGRDTEAMVRLVETLLRR